MSTKYSVLLLLINGLNFYCFPVNELRIVVDIPTYNNNSYSHNDVSSCIRNLKSVYDQEYGNYRVIIIDDFSDDETGNTLEKFIKDQGQEHRTILVRNPHRRKSLANHYSVIQMLKDTDDIVIHLDGDDFLKGTKVFNYINKIYQNPEIWITYGQYENWPKDQKFAARKGKAKDIPLDIIKNRAYRTRFSYTHLRTCRAWLARHIKLEDCICEKAPCKGQFYDSSAELALMFPMLEMADGRHKFCSKVLLYRNLDNPINVFKVNRTIQMQCAQLIKESPHYKPFAGRQIKKDKEKIVCKGVVFADSHVNELKECLDSFTKYAPSVALTVFHERSDKNENDAYQQLKKQYSSVAFVEMPKSKNLSWLIRDIIKKIRADYFLIASSKYALTKPLHLGKYARIVENTFAYTVTFNPSTQKFPPHTWLLDDIFVWKFKLAGSDWLKPHNSALSLYRKHDLLKSFDGLTGSSLKRLLKAWSQRTVNQRKVGLIVKQTTEN